MDAATLLQELREAEAAYRATLDAARQHSAQIMRDARERLGLTQAQLAERLGVDNSHISKIETGGRPAGKRLLAELLALLEAARAEENDG